MSEQSTGDNTPASTASATSQTTQLSEEQVKSHPLFQKLESEHAAAVQDASMWKGRLEKTQKPGAEAETKEAPTPDYVTKSDLWERDNQRKIALAGDEFQKLKEAGLKADEALELALFRKGYHSSEAVSDALRQAESSSAPSVVDRSGSADSRTPEQKAVAQRMGITAEDYAKYAERAAKMVTRVGA